MPGQNRDAPVCLFIHHDHSRIALFFPDIRRDRTYGDSCRTDKKQIVARLKGSSGPIRKAFVDSTEAFRQLPACAGRRRNTCASFSRRCAAGIFLRRCCQNLPPECRAILAETDHIITHQTAPPQQTSAPPASVPCRYSVVNAGSYRHDLS